jgi:predicted  nucleic acid-binding Zn-ribbon protein
MRKKEDNVARSSGPIAQRLEPPAHNRLVPGSNPGRPTHYAHSSLPKMVTSLKETASTWDTIVALRALQEIDNSARVVADERDRLRIRLAQLQEALERGQEDLDNRQRKISDAEVWFGEQQDGLKLEKEKASKLKAKLAAVTKSKEYMAIQRELEMHRQSINDKEEELSRFTDALGSHRKAVSDEESRLTSLQDEANEEKSATKRSINKFEKKITAINGNREQYTALVPADILRRYERVKSRREGIAICEVQNGHCKGCNMTIPPQLFNVILRRDSLEICPSCNRYVYVGIEEKTEEETAAQA